MVYVPFRAHSQKEADMKKIQLKLDTLSVESFETAVRVEERGTVNGNQLVTRSGGGCTNTTCPPYNCFCTEDYSCRCQ
jgi:hypothetical protein